MGFPEFRHIQLQQRIRLPIDGLRERTDERRFAHAGRPLEQERPGRTSLVPQTAPQAADGVTEARDHGVMADDRLAEGRLERAQTVLCLVRHPADGDACPRGRDHGDIACPDRLLPAERRPRTRLVQQVERLVRVALVADILPGEPHARLQHVRPDRDAVILRIPLPHALEDAQRLLRGRLAHSDGLEASGERAVPLDGLRVLRGRGRADEPQRPAGERGLEKVGRVDRALCGTGAHDGVDLVDEEDDAAVADDLVRAGVEAFLEIAAVLRPRQQRPQVEREDVHPL